MDFFTIHIYKALNNCQQPSQALYARAHWVSVCISESAYTEYFDSYGLPTYKIEIILFLQRHSISWIFNGHTLQGLTSNICGHYCRIYAFQRAMGLSMTLFLKRFFLLDTPAAIKR